MSQHPSLHVQSAGKQHRNVLKRYEKIKILKEKSKWDESKDSIFKLPKVKSQKLKAKAGDVEKKEEVAGADKAAVPAGKAPATKAAAPAAAKLPAAKAAAPAKKK